MVIVPKVGTDRVSNPSRMSGIDSSHSSSSSSRRGCSSGSERRMVRPLDHGPRLHGAATERFHPARFAVSVGCTTPSEAARGQMDDPIRGSGGGVAVLVHPQVGALAARPTAVLHALRLRAEQCPGLTTLLVTCWPSQGKALPLLLLQWLLHLPRWPLHQRIPPSSLHLILGLSFIARGKPQTLLDQLPPRLSMKLQQHLLLPVPVVLLPLSLNLLERLPLLPLCCRLCRPSGIETCKR